MFVDACAIVSILSGEADAEAYGTALTNAAEAFTSPQAAWEAVIILARPEKFAIPFSTSLALVSDWLAERDIALRHPAAPPFEILRLAVEAAEIHGVGKTHLSSLDCFHYAQAKAAKAAMLTSDRLLRATDLKTLP